MSNKELGLQQDVLQLIEKIYCKKYIGRLEVHYREGDESDPTEYVLHMYPHMQLRAPLCMAFQCDTDEQFLHYVEEELKKRNLIQSDFYKIELHGSH